jgi:hypothetical protein
MSHTPAISNRLLAALAPRDLDALGAHLEPVALPHKQTLSNPGAPIEHVYFPEVEMVSLVQPLPGGMIEVGMIGNEGFVGVPVLLGADTSPLEGWSRFLVLLYGCKLEHSARRRLAALPSSPSCCAMPRHSRFRSPFRRHAMDDTP